MRIEGPDRVADRGEKGDLPHHHSMPSDLYFSCGTSQRDSRTGRLVVDAFTKKETDEVSHRRRRAGEGGWSK